MEINNEMNELSKPKNLNPRLQGFDFKAFDQKKLDEKNSTKYWYKFKRLFSPFSPLITIFNKVLQFFK